MSNSMKVLVVVLGLVLAIAIGYLFGNKTTYRKVTCKQLETAQDVNKAVKNGASYLDRDHDGNACGVKIE